MANAPYYQMRAGQFGATSNPANAVSQQFEHQNNGYDPSPSAESACQSSDAPSNIHEENHNLVELLEAATTAADQAAYAMTTSEATAQAGNKRKAASDVATPAGPVADDVLTTKRRRDNVPTDPQLQSIDSAMDDTPESSNTQRPIEALLNDARAAGVHSAAALFRRTSEKTSRKYTRPPMSKLFISLQLSPENFLHLQAQAKLYMLDPAHPERQNCVGNRGKGDTDIVKLRLFHCVRDFLSNGLGEHFFGENAEVPGETETLEAARALGEEKAPTSQERLVWPRDGNKIISLVTPLMRRMVTNERQRMYAIETRKGGGRNKDKEGSAEAGSSMEDQQLRIIFDPSMGPPQTRPQSSQSGSPTPHTPSASSQVYYANNPTTSDQETKDHSDLVTDQPLPLPEDGTADPHLNHINIFLTLPPKGPKQGAKLGEKRISAEQSGSLTWYNYNDFLEAVTRLVESAYLKHPELQSKNPPQDPHPDSSPGPSNESLRGLAVAANALQSEAAGPSTRALPEASRHPADPTSPPAADQPAAEEPSPAPARPSATPPRTTEPESRADPKHAGLLTRCSMKTVGADGWKVIGNAEDWCHVLNERAFAVWADGVCNVVVELQEASAGLVAGPAKVGAGGEEEGTEGEKGVTEGGKDVTES